MDKHEPIHRFLNKIPSGRFEPASGEGTLSGVAVEIGKNGLAERIAPVRLGGVLEEARPEFWS
jgi:calcineurin-like phosphoesterase